MTIWVSSRLTGVTTIRRMPDRGRLRRSVRDAAAAVESVKPIPASLAGLWPSPPVATPPETFTPVAPSGPRVAVALSVGRMTDFGDAPAFCPATAARRKKRGLISLESIAAGPVVEAAVADQTVESPGASSLLGTRIGIDNLKDACEQRPPRRQRTVISTADATGTGTVTVLPVWLRRVGRLGAPGSFRVDRRLAQGDAGRRRQRRARASRWPSRWRPGRRCRPSRSRPCSPRR